MNAVAKTQDTEAAAPTALLTPMAMVQHAVQSGAGLDMVSKLMDLHERWEANQARKAFDEAIAGAKAEIKPVARNATGHNNKRYANFAAYAKEVDPILAKFGLSYRFRTSQDGQIKVTCILSHKDGHCEENTLAGPADTSGNKNAIQAIGSTLTYLQRYTLTQALGLAASDDDDGKAGGAGETLTDAQAGVLDRMITEAGADKAAFLKFMHVEQLADIPAVKFQAAKMALEAKRKQAKQVAK